MPRMHGYVLVLDRVSTKWRCGPKHHCAWYGMGQGRVMEWEYYFIANVSRLLGPLDNWSLQRGGEGGSKDEGEDRGGQT